jgi:hypothetical protein
MCRVGHLGHLGLGTLMTFVLDVSIVSVISVVVYGEKPESEMTGSRSIVKMLLSKRAL